MYSFLRDGYLGKYICFLEYREKGYSEIPILFVQVFIFFYRMKDMDIW